MKFECDVCFTKCRLTVNKAPPYIGKELPKICPFENATLKCNWKEVERKVNKNER